jgi:Ca2+-binding EF-hand superfamily protein
MFRLIDLNDDGMISIDEFKTVSKTFGEEFNMSELDLMFKGKNGLLNLKGNGIFDSNYFE